MKKRVGVLRGGNKEHYEKSLKKGGELILHIVENLGDGWQVVDILVDTNGVWHADGLPIEPVELVNKVDIIWNTSHPNFSVIVKSLGIRDVGIDQFHYILKDNRSILQDHMKELGVKMPRHFVIPAYQTDFDKDYDKFILNKAKLIHEKFSPPWIVKSLSNDQNIGIHIANTYPELINALDDIAKNDESILVEEFISGKEVSMHSIKGFRGQEIYNMAPVLYNGGNPLAPWNFKDEEKEKLNEISKKIFNHLNIQNYLNSYFIIHPKRGLFLKDVEFHPDIKNDSEFTNSALYIGAKPEHIVEHILSRNML